jgi:hypothetical protein
MADVGAMLHDRHCPVTSRYSGQWFLSRGGKPPGLDIYRGVDRLGT